MVYVQQFIYTNSWQEGKIAFHIQGAQNVLSHMEYNSIVLTVTRYNINKHLWSLYTYTLKSLLIQFRTYSLQIPEENLNV